jgi:uncharacterized protein
MRLASLTFILLLALGLAGCASPSGNAVRYTLPDIDAPGGGREASHTLALETPRLAHYLDVEGIVMQLDDITLVEARRHQWAEALDRQLARGLRARLAEQLSDTRVLLDEGSRPADALRLRLEVTRFQGHPDGTALVAGQWQLRAPEGELLGVEAFRVVRELEADGYPALVRALGRGWDEVARDLGEAIEELR